MPNVRRRELVRRREFILMPRGSQPLGRAAGARQSPRGYRGALVATHLWRLTAALAATILLGSLLSWAPEARIVLGCCEGPSPMCTVRNPARSTVPPHSGGFRERPAPAQ